MKKTFIVANWKSNMTSLEAKNWLQGLKIEDLRLTNKEIIICPPFTALPILKSLIINHKSSIKLGAQDVSPFNEGAYTGEISAKQIKEFAEFVLIGHSERRKNFLESDEMLFKKVELANKWSLKTIFCADNEESLIPEGVSIVTYEPPTSISPAPADTPENAERMAKALKTKTSIETILYGGNVTSENVFSFTKMESISGVLVGRASLDAQEFYAIIQNA